MIDCKSIAAEIKEGLKRELDKVENKPRLAIIQVGNNEASNRYVKGKIADCEEVGIDCEVYKLDDEVAEGSIIELIWNLNWDDDIHGIIVQLPLPKHMNEEKILQHIAEYKDVDGFSQSSPFTPCTPLGVLTLLEKLNVDVRGKWVTLVGYGKLVNKPLFPILSDMGATVCVCRSNTRAIDLDILGSFSDIIITAVGKHGIIRGDYLDRQIVIDCGIEVIDGKQYGDCEEGVCNVVDRVTPRIGGMGLMTRAALMMNVVKAWKEQI